MKKTFCMASALASCLTLLAACGLEKKTLQGSVQLTAYESTIMYIGPDDKRCVLSDEWSPFRVGSKVIVKDESSQTVAVGEVNKSEFIEMSPPARGCKVSFTVKDVPSSKFYSVEIGGKEAGTYKKDELDSKNWTLDLAI
jgi:hypothetical protein